MTLYFMLWAVTGIVAVLILALSESVAVGFVDVHANATYESQPQGIVSSHGPNTTYATKKKTAFDYIPTAARAVFSTPPPPTSLHLSSTIKTAGLTFRFNFHCKDALYSTCQSIHQAFLAADSARLSVMARAEPLIVESNKLARKCYDTILHTQATIRGSIIDGAEWSREGQARLQSFIANRAARVTKGMSSVKYKLVSQFPARTRKFTRKRLKAAKKFMQAKWKKIQLELLILQSRLVKLTKRTSKPKGWIDFDENEEKERVLNDWANDPYFQRRRSLGRLLVRLDDILPEHSYFSKWEPMQKEGTTQRNVINRAVRQAKLLLHPDKLPHDLNNKDLFICNLIWSELMQANEKWKRKEKRIKERERSNAEYTGRH